MSPDRQASWFDMPELLRDAATNEFDEQRLRRRFFGCGGAVCDRSRQTRASLSCSTARVCLSSGPVRERPRSPVAVASVAGGRATVAMIGQA